MSSTADPTCQCGHTAHWHSHDGNGDCEHDASCACDVFIETDRLQWKPQSLSTTVLERIVVDALADLHAAAWRRDQSESSRHFRYREALERLSEQATGIPLAGLPSSARATGPHECGFCGGKPVQDAASWLDGKPRDPAPCPRCGITTPLDDGLPPADDAPETSNGGMYHDEHGPVF